MFLFKLLQFSTQIAKRIYLKHQVFHHLKPKKTKKHQLPPPHPFFWWCVNHFVSPPGTRSLFPLPLPSSKTGAPVESCFFGCVPSAATPRQRGSCDCSWALLGARVPGTRAWNHGNCWEKPTHNNAHDHIRYHILMWMRKTDHE